MRWSDSALPFGWLRHASSVCLRRIRKRLILGVSSRRVFDEASRCIRLCRLPTGILRGGLLPQLMVRTKTGSLFQAGLPRLALGGALDPAFDPPVFGRYGRS